MTETKLIPSGCLSRALKSQPLELDFSGFIPTYSICNLLLHLSDMGQCQGERRDSIFSISNSPTDRSTVKE